MGVPQTRGVSILDEIQPMHEARVNDNTFLSGTACFQSYSNSVTPNEQLTEKRKFRNKKCVGQACV